MVYTWLFNVFMDSLVREVKMESGEEGLKMSANGGEPWRVSMVLCADDTVLLGESEENRQRLVAVFNRE